MSLLSRDRLPLASWHSITQPTHLLVKVLHVEKKNILLHGKRLQPKNMQMFQKDQKSPFTVPLRRPQTTSIYTVVEPQIPDRLLDCVWHLV